MGRSLKVNGALDQSTEMNGEETTKNKRWIPLSSPPYLSPSPQKKSFTLHSDNSDIRLGEFDYSLGEADYYRSRVSRDPEKKRPP